MRGGAAGICEGTVLGVGAAVFAVARLPPAVLAAGSALAARCAAPAAGSERVAAGVVERFAAAG